MNILSINCIHARVKFSFNVIDTYYLSCVTTFSRIDFCLPLSKVCQIVKWVPSKRVRRRGTSNYIFLLQKELKSGLTLCALYERIIRCRYSNSNKHMNRLNLNRLGLIPFDK